MRGPALTSDELALSPWLNSVLLRGGKLPSEAAKESANAEALELEPFQSAENAVYDAMCDEELSWRSRFKLQGQGSSDAATAMPTQLPDAESEDATKAAFLAELLAGGFKKGSLYHGLIGHLDDAAGAMPEKKYHKMCLHVLLATLQHTGSLWKEVQALVERLASGDEALLGDSDDDGAGGLSADMMAVHAQLQRVRDDLLLREREFSVS